MFGAHWMRGIGLLGLVILLALPAAAGAQRDSGEEVALAGKGFSKEVEAEYKKQNAKLDYVWVDRMLLFKIPEAQLVEFLQQGGLVQ